MLSSSISETVTKSEVDSDDDELDFCVLGRLVGDKVSFDELDFFDDELFLSGLIGS
jgi:hypothetical protein